MARPIWLLAVLLFAVTGPALASHVSNGAIQGAVIAPDGQPLAGVTVVAVRQDQPPIIRNSVTDEMGNFFVPDLYVGSYTLGFSKFGFRTITTQQGDPNNRTALGSQVRAFVEPGRVSVVGTIRMTPDAGSFGGTVTVQVSDAATGEPLDDASVIVGPSAAGGPGTGGRYTLFVPPNVDAQGNVQPVRAIIQADGFERQETLVTPVPNGNSNLFVRMQPTKALLTGTVRLGFGIPLEEITNVRVLVANVDPSQASGRVVDQTGHFQVVVPASTATRVRTFNLMFVLNGARVATLTNVIAPRAGASTVPQPVPIEPNRGSVLGQVLLSDGTLPLGGSQFDRVVILELGQAVPLVNGSYFIQGMPLGRTFTLQVEAINPRTRLAEIGQARITPVSDGSANPVFNVPLIVTRGGGGFFGRPF